ncbi:uncharacterized protein Triagg1_4911 [Trichoderma aggressivum f. europaeum]|uniref:BZIP domain-containing protein n=1 Tax=Trichoderma aggressivum f. europaeum TaxID=173218 RepID=A0AAE1LZW6_9HYPO|nr:hypothetical protein Triagg1_4911 [Trichoderma aggressivum f. europaeum]
MADRIFRIFNPGEPKGDPVEKRRAQLRRAQQSYRDRKDKYTKALEAELARSRKSEAGLTSQIEQLRAKVHKLATLLSQNGISLPLDFDDEGDVHDDVSRIDASPLATRGQPLPADGFLSSTDSTSPESTTDHGVIFNSGNRTLRQYGSRIFARHHEPQVPAPTRFAGTITQDEPGDRTRLAELDATQVGMEFVLTLERPCLNHLHGNPKKPLEPHGHALTTTVQLQASLSLPPIDPRNPVPPSYQNAPAAVLDRLLNLAPSVSPDGDVTPIQAWHFIRRQPQFGGFEVQRLNRLAERLREAAKCHGFGAAVQTGIFESAVREILQPLAITAA